MQIDGCIYGNRTHDIKITFIVAASALYSIKICLATPAASYFRSFTQTHTNHQRHSLSGRDYMLRFQRSAMFVITSCREASVISNHLLAPRLGFEPRSRTFVGWHTIHCANTVCIKAHPIACIFPKYMLVILLFVPYFL